MKASEFRELAEKKNKIAKIRQLQRRTCSMGENHSHEIQIENSQQRCC